MFLIVIHFACNTYVAQAQGSDFDETFIKASSFNNVNTDSILFYSLKAYDIAQNRLEPRLQIDALMLVINTQIKKGEFSHAILNCLKADSIVLANNLSNEKDEILMYKGLAYQTSGLNAEALRYFFDAKKISEQSGHSPLNAEIDYYIAVGFYNLQEMEKCRQFAKQAISWGSNEDEQTNYIKNLLLISNTFQDADSIKYYLLYADKISRGNKSNYYRVTLLNNIALFYKSMDKKSKAKTYYLEAIKISSLNGYNEYLATLYNNFAYLLMAESKYDSAAIELAKALEIANQLGNDRLIASVLDSYSDYFAETGNAEKSLQYYKQSVKLKNKYKEKQQVEESLFLSTVYETEKKQLEIERQKARLFKTNVFLIAFAALFVFALVLLLYWRQLLTLRKNKISALNQEKKLEVANALIEGQDAERKRLAMDLHDGVMPMIGSLQMLIDSNFEKHYVYPEMKFSIKEIGADIRELTHRMLPSQLESKGLVATLENYIQQLKQNSKIKFRFFTNLKNRLPATLEMNIYFLFYEMINNAVKHSGASEIIVQLLETSNATRLSVEDDGSGFDTKKEYNGIGLKNIRQRVTYLNGTIDIDSVPGEGVSFLIEIKKINNAKS